MNAHPFHRRPFLAPQGVPGSRAASPGVPTPPSPGGGRRGLAARFGMASAESPRVPGRAAGAPVLVLVAYLGCFLLTSYTTPISGELVRVARWGALAGAFAWFGISMRRRPPARALATWFFLAVCVVSSMRSEARALSLAKLAPAALCIAMMFGVLPAALRPPTYARALRTLGAILIAMAWTSLAAGVATGRLFGIGRYQGLFGGPNSEGLYLGISSVLALFLHSLPEWRARRGFLFFTFLAFLSATYATGSRSSFFAAGAAAGVWFAIQILMTDSRRARRAGALVLAGGCALVLGREFYMDRWTIMMRSWGGETFFSSREERWNDSIAAFRERPNFGHGFGVSAFDWNEDAEIGAEAEASVRDGAGYLAVLESVGWIGTAMFALIVLEVFRAEWRVLRSRSRSAFAPYAHGALAVSIMLLVNLVGEPWILGPGSPTFQLFWLFLAATLHFATLARNDDRRAAASARASRVAWRPARAPGPFVGPAPAFRGAPPFSARPPAPPSHAG